MKVGTKMIMASGYVILAGLGFSSLGYIPAEVVGHMFCGIGLVLLIQGLNQLVLDWKSDGE